MTLSHTILGLSGGLYYDVTVQASNEVGNSIVSDATRIVAADPPDALAKPTV